METLGGDGEPRSVWPALRTMARVLPQASLGFTVVAVFSCCSPAFSRRVHGLAGRARVMVAAGAPAGIGHLEDPATLDNVMLAQGVGTSQVTPRNVLDGVFAIATYYIAGLGSAVLLMAFRWWAPPRRGGAVPARRRSAGSTRRHSEPAPPMWSPASPMAVGGRLERLRYRVRRRAGVSACRQASRTSPSSNLVARETVGVGLLADLDDADAVGDALARASAEGVVESLPSGLETQLGKSFGDAAELSGGQWQKLALGRAMMRPDPLLLLLDEPTASLDAQTEHGLFERYAGAARRSAQSTGAIALLVSHRFSTVRMADLIVVVDGSTVREVGSHAELLAADGLHTELFELQARAYR